MSRLNSLSELPKTPVMSNQSKHKAGESCALLVCCGFFFFFLVCRALKEKNGYHLKFTVTH